MKFNPFYKDLMAQKELILTLKSRTTDPMKRGKIDDYLEMFNQFSAKVSTSDGVEYSYSGNLDTDKLYGKNGNACKNVYELREFGDKIIKK